MTRISDQGGAAITNMERGKKGAPSRTAFRTTSSAADRASEGKGREHVTPASQFADRNRIRRKRETFDADPAGRKQAATGHVISRSIDNPGEVFVRVEFASA
jgi:hypothetical protein